MKQILTFLTFILFTAATFAQGQLEFKNQEIHLKDLMIDDQPTHITYKFKNKGNQPVIISRIIPFNNNLHAEWPKEPIAPGKSGEIRVNFISKNIQENFNYRLHVYSNASNKRAELSLSGNLVENPGKPELLYKYNMDGVKFKSNHINFNKIYTWQVVTDTVPYLNMRQEAISITTQYKPGHIEVKAVPEKVEPGKKGLLYITYDAPKKNDYGFTYESVILSFNNERNYNHRLSINASLTEDFSKLSAKELAAAPVASFDKKEISFGEIKQGSKTDCDFTLTNTGKTTLIIRKTKASCGCTAVTLGQKELAPGASTVIRATFDSSGKNGRQYKTITVITNDPKHPEISLSINGNIIKS